MPVAKLIAPTTKQEIPKLRVAAYCRVSSNSADQRNSFATQERVYTKYIAEKQEWELVDIFADEGLSGMKADNRPEFQRMIRMCELRQIDLILTKSVSRFARNVKEALNYTRKLKQLGIELARGARRDRRALRRCCSRLWPQRPPHRLPPCALGRARTAHHSDDAHRGHGDRRAVRPRLPRGHGRCHDLGRHAE